LNESSSSRQAQLTRGYTIAVISAAVFSVTSILALFRRPLLKVPAGQLGFLVLNGLILAVFNSTWTLSVVYNGAAIATILAYISAGFTVLLGWAFLKERLDWGKGLAVVFSLAGCLLVSGAYRPQAWSLHLAGIFTGITSGLWYALYTLMSRSASNRGINPWTTLTYTFGFGALFILAVNLFSRGTIPGSAVRVSDLLWLRDAWAGWGLLFFLAAGPSVAGFGLYNVSLTYLPAGVANLVLTLEPVITAVIATLFLNEQLNWIQILGGGLILGGVVFLRLHEGRGGRLDLPPE
jgi:drug/metabolite transporter (DMT)-like permease